MTKYKVLILIILTSVIINGCSSVNVTSTWADTFISIDGIDDEWQSSTYYIKDQNLLLGVKNDDENFYFALMTSDEANIGKIMRGGLTLWFDNETGGDKKFGVRFPAGMEMPKMPRGESEFNSGAQGMKKPDFFAIEKEFNELEILGPEGKNAARMNIDAVKGIDTKTKILDGKLIYEFKIALKKTDPTYYAIEINEDKMFSLGIETAEMNTKNKKIRGGEMPDGDMPPGGGPGGGMPGGPGGGMPGGPGGPGGPGPMGGGRPGVFVSQEPLSYWLNVTLSDNK